MCTSWVAQIGNIFDLTRRIQLVHYTGFLVDNVQKFTEIINRMWRKKNNTNTHPVLLISSAAATCTANWAN